MEKTICLLGLPLCISFFRIGVFQHVMLVLGDVISVVTPIWTTNDVVLMEWTVSAFGEKHRVVLVCSSLGMSLISWPFCCLTINATCTMVNVFGGNFHLWHTIWRQDIVLHKVDDFGNHNQLLSIRPSIGE